MEAIMPEDFEFGYTPEDFETEERVRLYLQYNRRERTVDIREGVVINPSNESEKLRIFLYRQGRLRQYTPVLASIIKPKEQSYTHHHIGLVEKLDKGIWKPVKPKH